MKAINSKGFVAIAVNTDDRKYLGLPPPTGPLTNPSMPFSSLKTFGPSLTTTTLPSLLSLLPSNKGYFCKICKWTIARARTHTHTLNVNSIV